jgi:hypothetical protein
MASVRFDAAGRLLKLWVVPPTVRGETNQEETARTGVDWTPLLKRADLDSEKLTAVTSSANPLLPCETRTAWEGTYEGADDVLLHVEACAARGSPLYFEVFAPWNNNYDAMRSNLAESDETNQASPRDGIPLFFEVIVLSIVSVVFLATFLLARRNLRLGRADRQGALRIAAFILFVSLISRILSANHGGSSPIDEIQMLSEVVAHALVQAMFA